MSVVTRSGITTVTPTAWKWFAGAAALVGIALATRMFNLPVFLAALLLAGIGAGAVFTITLDRDGLAYRNFWKFSRFGWADISGFKVNTMRYGLFPVLKQIAFTEARSAGSIHGKLAKLVAGGTHTVPVYGIDADRLIRLMLDYQQGRVPADTPMPEPGMVQAPQAKAPVVRPQQGAQAVTARRPPPAPIAAGRIRTGQDPLIQDSASRRRATRNSPLG